MGNKMERLTPPEEEAMRIVWKRGGGVIKEFLQELPAPRPPYTTFASIVKNLERKGYVAATKYGNTYYYKAAVSEKEYKRQFLSGVVRDYFANSYRDLVSFFAEEEKLTKAELEEIIETIERGTNK